MPKTNKEFSFRVADSDFSSAGGCNKDDCCVLVAHKPEGVAIRDSKDPAKKTLFFTHAEFRAFIKSETK